MIRISISAEIVVLGYVNMTSRCTCAKNVILPRHAPALTLLLSNVLSTGTGVSMAETSTTAGIVVLGYVSMTAGSINVESAKKIKARDKLTALGLTEIVALALRPQLQS